MTRLSNLASLSNQPSKTQRACEAIWQAIAADGLEPGDTLPSEGELAERLGISRMVIRHAVTALQALGIVERMHGVGLRVGPCDLQTPLIRTIHLLAGSPQGLIDLMDLRMVQEVGAACLWFDQIGESQLEILEENLARTAEAGDLQELRKLDCDFHLALLPESRLAREVGELIVTAFRTLAAELPELPGMYNTHESHRQDLIARHRELVEAIRGRQKDRFIAGLIRHLGSYAVARQYLAQRATARDDGQSDTELQIGPPPVKAGLRMARR